MPDFVFLVADACGLVPVHLCGTRRSMLELYLSNSLTFPPPAFTAGYVARQL